MATREQVLSDPRGGARPLGGSDPGSGETRSYPRYSRSTELPRSSSRSSQQKDEPGPRYRYGQRAERVRSAEYEAQPTTRRSAKSPARTSRRSSPARQVRRQYNAHVTTNYERVIVAEFVLAVFLVAAAPFTRSNKTGISPYYGQDMVQIVAIMAAYFILGLVAQAGGATARISAWFGGLLLLGIGLGEASYLAKEFNLFGASTTGTSNTNSTTTPNNAGAAPTQGT